MATAEEEVAGNAPALTSEEQATYEDIVSNENNFNHIFDPKHNFGDLVSKLGSREAVLEEIVRGLSTIELPTSGSFLEAPVMVAGRIVFVNGAGVNGIIRIGTAYIPKIG